MRSIELTSLQEASCKKNEATVATVKLLLDNSLNAEKTVFVVEGKDDVDFYASFLKTDSVCIYPDGNCAKHLVILNALNGNYGGRILAVKDADFDRLEGRSIPFKNLLLTDAHDLEGMILMGGIPSLPDDDAKRCKTIELDALYAELKDISYLKWYNHANHIGLDFKGISLDLGFEAYLAAVMANTANAENVNIGDVMAFRQRNPNVSLPELCNGHDLFERIYVRAKCVNNENFAKKPFFSRLRKSYTKEKFSTTFLFDSITKWEDAYSKSIIEA